MKENPADMRSLMKTVVCWRAPEFTGFRPIAISCVVGLFALASFTPALAQDYNYDELPVLSPNVDFNGVSPTSGTFATASPLHFAAPGAGHLDLNVIFNGKKNTFNLNVYVEDQTFTRGDGDPDIRHVKVHLGGQDKLFTCDDGQPTGVCEQDRQQDGSILKKTAPYTYVFTDRTGAIYTFDHYAYVSDPNVCYDFDQNCNAAGYKLYAFVNEITYPNGEKLTFEPYSTVEPTSGGYVRRDTIRSNLGYRQVFETDVPQAGGSYPPGTNWLVHRGNLLIDRAILYNGSQLINTLRMSTVQSGDLTIKTQRDDLGREYRAEFLNKAVKRCAPITNIHSAGYTIDQTPKLPVLVRTPGGVTTTISYYMTEDGQQFEIGEGPWQNIPVKTVTRGGQAWHYDNVRDMKTMTDPAGQDRTSSVVYLTDGYDYGEIFSQCMPDGYQETVYVDAKITSYDDELSRHTTYGYDFSNDRDFLKDANLPEGNSYQYDYDARGNLTRITQEAKPGSGLPNRVVFQADYPDICNNPITCNKPVWVRDAKGNQTDYTYDAVHGGVLTTTLPADSGGIRPQRLYTYTAHDTGDGLLYRLTQTSACITGASCVGTDDERITVTAYWNDTFLPATVTETLGDGSLTAATSFAYDTAGRPIQVTDPRGNATTWFYDAVGQRTGEISADPDGAEPLPRLATRLTYNDDGQVIRTEKGTAAGTTTADFAAMTVTKTVETTYDSVGRKAKEQVKAGGTAYAVTQYSYDATSRLQCVAVRMNPAAFGSPPSSACVLGSAGSYGLDRVTRNVYDAAGQLTTVQKAYGTPLQQDYAINGYSDNGKRASVTDANGNKASFVYDGYDRLARWNFPSKTTPGQVDTADYEAYTYDANDNRASLRKRDGQSIGYSYDNLNRITLKDVPGAANDVYYDYDLRGLQLFARFGSASGQGITTVYDGLGRADSSTTTMGGVSRPLNYRYDLNGNRTRITHPDGTYFTYVYDDLDRNTEILQSDSTSLVTLVYDAPGRRAELQRLNGAYTGYDYDGISRLDGIINDLAGTADDVDYAFGYNPASQIVSRTISNNEYEYANFSSGTDTYSANGLNQYSAVDGETYGYDLNGNLTSDGVPTTYTYDIENRLISAAGDNSVTLKYDPLGRLYEVSDSGTTTGFLYDGDALVAEYNAGGAVTNRYVHGPGVDEPLVWYDGSGVTDGSRRFLYADHIGSITGITNNAGTVITVNSYDSYGVGDPLNFGRFAYTGQVRIPELGLYYYKARFYGPTLGRFMQVDPIGYEDQINLYNYVYDDPINAKDPTGTDCTSDDSGSTTCTPNDERFEKFSFETPKDWTDFKKGDASYHDYTQEESAGAGDDEFGEHLTEELTKTPTPGEGAATPDGNIVNVNIPGPFRKDEVVSTVRKESDGEAFITNVTTSNHTLHSGFVIRKVVPDGNGGYAIITYGEGNAWKQKMPGVAAAAIRTWKYNSQGIIKRAGGR